MTTADGSFKSEYWRRRAETTRLQSKAMHDIDTKVTMYRIAEMYDRMADRANEREVRGEVLTDH
jgi:hypothetical protein